MMQDTCFLLDEEEEEERENKELVVPNNTRSWQPCSESKGQHYDTIKNDYCADNCNNNTKLTTCDSLMSESQYERTFKNIDCTGVFSTQRLFQEALVPNCESSVSSFLSALCTAFTQWRDANWNNCFTVVVKDAVKFRLALDTWRESIRVQRLMIQHLLTELLNHNYVHSARNSVVEPNEEEEYCEHLENYEPEEEEESIQHEKQSVSNSTVQNNNKKIWKKELYEEFMKIRYVEIAHTFVLLYIVDKLWECDESVPFRLAVTATEAPSYYKAIKDVVSLDHLYQNIYSNLTFNVQQEIKMEKEWYNEPELEQMPDSSIKETVSKCRKNALAEYNAFDFVSLRERLAILLHNCQRFNEIGSALALDAEKLVKLGNRLIREMQSEGEHSILEFLQKNNVENGYNRSVDKQSEELHMETVTRCNYILDFAQLEELLPCCNNLQMEYEETLLEENSHLVGKSNEKKIPAVNKLSLSTSNANKLLTRKLKLKAQDESELNSKAITDKATKATDKGKSKRSKQNHDNNSKNDKETVYWMQCDLCHQWRVIPEPLDPLPEHWYCADINERCENRTTNADELSVSSVRSAIHPQLEDNQEEQYQQSKLNQKRRGRRPKDRAETAKMMKIDNNSSNGSSEGKGRVIKLHNNINHTNKHNTADNGIHLEEKTRDRENTKEDNRKHWFNLSKKVNSVPSVAVDGGNVVKNESKAQEEDENETKRRVLKLFGTGSASHDENANSRSHDSDQETRKLKRVTTEENKRKRRRKQVNSSSEGKEEEVMYDASNDSEKTLKRGRVSNANVEKEQRESRKENHRRKRARKSKKVDKPESEEELRHTLHKHTSHSVHNKNRSKLNSEKKHKREQSELPLTYKIESEVPLADLQSASSLSYSSYSSPSSSSSFSRLSRSSSSTASSWSSSYSTTSSSYTSSTSSLHNHERKSDKKRLSSFHTKIQQKHLTNGHNKKVNYVNKESAHIQSQSVASTKRARKVTEQQISEMEVQMTTIETVSYNDNPVQILKQLRQMERKLRERRLKHVN